MTALATPLTSRQARSRLALLATTLTMALGVVVLSLAWLWPQIPSRIVEVPLNTLEVGVPRFLRPFEMGTAPAWGGYGIWLVAHSDGSVSAFYSRGPSHRCAVVPAAVVDHRSGLTPAVPGVTVYNPSSDPIPVGNPTVAGFRELCRGGTFTARGSRVFGPSSRGLDSFPTSTRNGVVAVETGTLRWGACPTLPPSDASACATPAHPIVRRSAAVFREP